MKKILLFCLLGLTSFLYSQSIQEINTELERSAQMYKVPVDLLKSVAWSESHFNHHIPSAPVGHNNKPSSYGVMGLRNDNWFGYSLKIGAGLINRTENEVINDFRLNIQAGAAYLSSLGAKNGAAGSDLNTWKRALELYSGIPQNDIKEFYSYDCFYALKNGVSVDEISIMAHPEMDLNQFPEKVKANNSAKNLESDDYPAAVWSPSQNFTTGSINQKFCVVHDTEGGFAGSLSWLQNPDANASAHYIIRSSDGYIAQLVREANRAWHVVCWNPYMLGVEHEGYISNPNYFTDAMYISSAALYRHFCTKFNIPMDRNHIIGHNEWQNNTWKTWMAANFPSIDLTCNSHTDPGSGWDWDLYLSLIRQDTVSPYVTGYNPTNPNDSIWANSPIKITFSQRMKKPEAQAAFSITPAIAGTFTWENYQKTLVFRPNTAFNLATTYHVTLAATAKNLNDITVRGGVAFDFVTKATSVLSVAGSYPVTGNSGISTSARLLVKFDSPLLQSSINGNVVLTDSAGNQVTWKSITYSEVDFKGMIMCQPNQLLKPGAKYKLTVKPTLKNISGGQMTEEYSVSFTTSTRSLSLGNVIDQLEVIGGWKSPTYSGSTVGVNGATTTFTISTDAVFEGASSAKFNVDFTDANGVCREFNSSKPNVGSTATRYVGAWINGDYSNNYLEYWFYYNSSTNVIVPVDTLNWTGWKLVEIPISSIAGSGDRLFHSIVIRRNPTSGSANSLIYVDALQTRELNGISDAVSSIMPTRLSLEQNYPNPFNPATSVRYSLTKEGQTSLKIYDILGNEVATIFNEVMQPGTYSTSLDFSRMQKGLASGVYFYRLVTPAGSISKKLNYIK